MTTLNFRTAFLPLTAQEMKANTQMTILPKPIMIPQPVMTLPKAAAIANTVNTAAKRRNMLL